MHAALTVDFTVFMKPASCLFRSFTLALLSWIPLVSQAEPELSPASAHALDFVAPADRWAIRLEVRSNGWNQRYDNNGRKVAMGADFDQVNLDSTLFPALVALGPGATLGTTHFTSRLQNRYAELALGYGATDNLTIGVLIPFGTTRNKVNFSVSGGNVGFNPAFNPAQPIDATNFPFAPVGAGVVPVGTEGVQQILTDPAFGYAYQRIESTSTSGLGDPTFGLLWRFHKTSIDSLVLGLGFRFGLADADDPDNLLDYPTGDSSRDLRAQLEYYRNLGNDFDLRLLLDRKVQLNDRVRVRVPAPGQLLALASSKETVNRDLGNFWEYDVEIGHRWDDWRGSLTWHRYDKKADHYSSDIGTDTSALEANTRIYANQWRASVSWSGINAWRDGDIPLPLIVRLEIQRTYAGRNFVDVNDIYVRVTSFF